MYAPVTLFLEKLFNDTAFIRQHRMHVKMSVFDTHDTRFLGNHAPDIAICPPMINNANVISAKALVELKPPGAPITLEARGQAYDYLLRLAGAQPNRNTFTILVSNIVDDEFNTIVRDADGDFTVSHHGLVQFVVALVYLCIVSSGLGLLA